MTTYHIKCVDCGSPEVKLTWGSYRVEFFCRDCGSFASIPPVCDCPDHVAAWVEGDVKPERPALGKVI